MAQLRMKYANLDENGLAKVRTFEEQSGAVVLVMESVQQVAKLEEDQVHRIQALEKELGVILVAYPKTDGKM